MAESVIKTSMAWKYLDEVALTASTTPTIDLPSSFTELYVLLGLASESMWECIIPRAILSSSEKVIRNGANGANMLGNVKVTLTTITGEIFLNGSRQNGLLTVYYR